mmetsp:Transcript_9483/g.27114  ORF Transcript_9483/g.27114 Transcript_9483/m.27114 type:complete len:295 (-) Transcript_9483:183-1067(-)
MAARDEDNHGAGAMERGWGTGRSFHVLGVQGACVGEGAALGYARVGTFPQAWQRQNCFTTSSRCGATWLAASSCDASMRRPEPHFEQRDMRLSLLNLMPKCSTSCCSWSSALSEVSQKMAAASLQLIRPWQRVRKTRPDLLASVAAAATEPLGRWFGRMAESQPRHRSQRQRRPSIVSQVKRTSREEVGTCVPSTQVRLGPVSTGGGASWWGPEAEVVCRALSTTRSTGCPLHSSSSTSMVRAAEQPGSPALQYSSRCFAEALPLLLLLSAVEEGGEGASGRRPWSTRHGNCWG